MIDDVPFFINQNTPDDGRLLVIMTGPPGSGKSTIAKDLERDYDFIRVSPDDIRKDLFGDASIQSKNDIVFGKVYESIKNSLDADYNVVYDATNCRSNYRYKVLDVAKNRANLIFCVMATTPLVECFKRNNIRDRHVPEEVIERMYLTYKKHPPTIFEGYDLIVKF